MVQVLPYVPGFGEQLAQALGSAGGNIGAAYAKRAQEKRAQTALDKLLNPQKQAPEEAPKEPGQAPQPGITPAGQASNSPIQQVNQAVNEINPMKEIEIYKQAVKAYGKEPAALLFKSRLEQQKLSAKEGIEERKDIRHEESEIKKENRGRRNTIVEKNLQEGIGRRDAIRKERQDLRLGLNAVESGDVGGFDINYLAQSLGPAGDPLKNVKGVQLESAMKNLLVDTLQKTSGRPNQWIEQQIKSATPSIGKTKEANETLFASALANLDIEEKLLDARDGLIAEYDKSGITPPSNIEQLTHEIVKPYAQQVEDKLSYDLRRIYEKSKGESFLNNLQKVPKGTMLTIEKRDALMKKFGGNKEKVKEVAQKLGYTIPKSNVVIRTPIEGQ